MDELNRALSGSRIRSVLSNKLVATYEKTRKTNLLGSPTDLSTGCGRFAEQALAIIWEEGTGKTADENNIRFGAMYDEIENLPSAKKQFSQGELLYIVLPRALRSIYTIRSKKEGAHTKTSTVELLDKQALMTLCNWSLAQLVFVFCGDANLMEGLLPKIVQKNAPSFQKFEDGRVLVFNDLSEQDTLLFIVYLHDGGRIGRDELLEVSGLKRPNLRAAIRKLKKKKFIDENDGGILATNLGKAFIEENSKKYFVLNEVK